MEQNWLECWRESETFQQSVATKSQDKAYIFYDGPPFITGLPHPGTLLSSIAKDAIPRFWTMLGYRVERRWGWDCHGLPLENLVEAKLGLKNKQEVFDFGLNKYIQACRKNVVQTSSAWQESIDRIARWVEFKDAYKTMDADYMESVWWAFKKLYDQGLIYEGKKVLLYCNRCATPISKAEVAMDNSYRNVPDKGVYLKFELKPGDLASDLAKVAAGRPIKALAWTTTAWTLPANSGLAINPALDYSLIEVDQELFLLAKEIVAQLIPEATILVAKVDNQKFLKNRYRPIFSDLGDQAHRILPGDYVRLDSGTGVVHLAPAFGEEDYQLAQEHNLTILNNLDPNGCYNQGDFKGQEIWPAQEKIIDQLKERQLVFKVETFSHSYPHCYRCRRRLIYKAHDSWFLEIAKKKSQLLAHNQKINWFPEHLKEGRFAKNIAAAPDWNLSRDRFWATPMPIWRGQDKSGQTKTIVVGSYQELADLSKKKLKDYHRPAVDEITFKKDGVTYRRIDKVIDCWFESGAMPFAQFHYPFENKEKFEASLPADYVVEYIGQVRAWFYYLHVLAVVLFDKPAFKNVITTGTITGADGRKISKSLGNYSEPLEVIEKYSADAYRLALLSSVVMRAEDIALGDKEVKDHQRQLDRLRNVLEFFLLYASADGYQPNKSQAGLAPKNILDAWLLARLDQLLATTTVGLVDYDLVGATSDLPDFIDDLSNWYVRRSRQRFWKSQASQDKDQAYQTLYYVLSQVALIIAPFCPFLAEEIKDQLSLGPTTSIHLDDWPTTIRAKLSQKQKTKIQAASNQIKLEEPTEKDLTLLTKMSQSRQIISDGLGQRAAAGLRVRQPLAGIILSPEFENLDLEFQELIKAELNVKKVVFKSGQKEVALDQTQTPELTREWLMREIVRQLQAVRKKEKLEVSDRINLRLVIEEDSPRQRLAEVFMSPNPDGGCWGDYLIREILSNDQPEKLLVAEAVAKETAFIEIPKLPIFEKGLKVAVTVKKA